MSKSKIQFNINHVVRVRLTDHGRYVHRQNQKELFRGLHFPHKYIPPKENADGWSEWQLWELIAEFGKHTAMGGSLCFETIIEIPVDYEQIVPA